MHIACGGKAVGGRNLGCNLSRACACVCVCVRERVCVCERESVCGRTYMLRSGVCWIKPRQMTLIWLVIVVQQNACVCVCVCVCVRERECVCGRTCMLRSGSEFLDIAVADDSLFGL